MMGGVLGRSLNFQGIQNGLENTVQILGSLPTCIYLHTPGVLYITK